MIKADTLASGLAVTVNALADEGKMHPATIVLADGTRIKCNSTWGATDWLKKNDYYKENNDLGTFHIEWPS